MIVSVKLLPACTPPAIPKSKILILSFVDLRLLEEKTKSITELEPDKVVKKIARKVNTAIIEMKGISLVNCLAFLLLPSLRGRSCIF